MKNLTRLGTDRSEEGMLNKYTLGWNPPSEMLKQHALIGADLIKRVGDKPFDDVQEFLDALHTKYPNYFPGARTKDEFRHHVHMVHMSHTWACTGFNTFRVTHGLAAALMLTDPGEQTEELMLPFPVFAVLVPPNVIPVFIGEGDKQVWGDLIWVYRFTGHNQSSGEPMPFFRWMVNKGEVSVWRDRHPEKLTVPADERVYAAEPGAPLPIEEDQISLSSSLRLVRNLISWIESTRFSLEKKSNQKPKKTKKNKKDKSKGPKPQVWVMGREVKLRPELRHLAGEISLGNTKHAPKGWKVRSRHIVSGHWRNQAHGPKLTLRKRMWIAPYWKGPKDGEFWAHVYKAGD